MGGGRLKNNTFSIICIGGFGAAIGSRKARFSDGTGVGADRLRDWQEARMVPSD
jgi:hypothetical protein